MMPGRASAADIAALFLAPPTHPPRTSSGFAAQPAPLTDLDLPDLPLMSSPASPPPVSPPPVGSARLRAAPAPLSAVSATAAPPSDSWADERRSLLAAVDAAHAAKEMATAALLVMQTSLDSATAELLAANDNAAALELQLAEMRRACEDKDLTIADLLAHPHSGSGPTAATTAGSGVAVTHGDHAAWYTMGVRIGEGNFGIVNRAVTTPAASAGGIASGQTVVVKRSKVVVDDARTTREVTSLLKVRCDARSCTGVRLGVHTEAPTPAGEEAPAHRVVAGPLD